MIDIKFKKNAIDAFTKKRIDSIDSTIIKALKETMDKWEKESLKVTPKKTGKLRSSANYYIKDGIFSGNIYGYIFFIAWDNIERVNYALVRHEVEARKYTTPGTHYKYLSGTVENNYTLFMENIKKREQRNNR